MSNNIQAIVPDNQPFITHLLSITSLYNKIKESRRAGVFARVARTVSQHPEVMTKESDLTTYAGVGASTQVELIEFLETGTSKRKEELLSNPEIKSIDDDRPLTDKVAEKLAIHSGQNEQMLKVSIIMTAAVNALSDVEGYKSNLDKFESHIIEAGLEEVLNNL